MENKYKGKHTDEQIRKAEMLFEQLDGQEKRELKTQYRHEVFGSTKVYHSFYDWYAGKLIDARNDFMMEERPLIGYQIVTANGDIDIPSQFYSFDVLSKRAADEWMNSQTEQERKRWKIVEVYHGDIEEPIFID